MKRLILVVFLFTLFYTSSKGQIFDTTFFSNSLNKDASICIYLPPGYYENPTFYYPVIYYLHGWNGNENSANSTMILADSLITYNIIDPVIIIGPNNNSDPFKGSFYINSITNGDYETYSIVDVVNYVENNYRAYPQKNYRSLMGQSMGGYGCFRLGILHKEIFRGIAAHGSPLNFDLIITDAIAEITTENQGPPYFYDYDNTGIFTKMIFAMSAAFTPNPVSTQTYISPTIVDFPLDDQGVLIDSIYQKWKPFDPVSFANTLLPSDSLAILYGDGSQDNLHLYPANIAFQDTLSTYGIEYEFYNHPYYHAMPIGFRARGLKFLDSIMSAPGEIYCNEPSNIQITEISQTAVQFTWSGEWNSSKWNIYFDTLGFDTTGMPPIEVTSKSFQVSGLSPNTYYDFYLQTFCTVGGESSWLGPYELKTFCDPITDNYFEDFEGTSLLPECWFNLTSDTSVLVTAIGSLCTSGNNSVVLCGDTMVSGFYGLATPELTELGSVPIEVCFSARTFQDTSNLYLGTMENPLNLDSWQVSDTLVIVDEFQQYAVKIDTFGIKNDRFVAFRHPNDSTHIFIDDFSYLTSDKKIDGYFNYYNNPKTPLKDLTLNLINSSDQVVNTTITDDNGYFEFVDIPNNTYTIDVSTSMETGGINSLDAGKANLWWTSPSEIEQIRWIAGEVDSSGLINATDAGMIQQHFVFNTPFTRGEWAFWKQNDVSSLNPPASINNIIIDGENFSQDFYGICVGDFKGDFIPNFTPRVSASDLILIKESTIISRQEMEFELPIKVTSKIQLAALSLIVDIPSTKVKVKDVYLIHDLAKIPVDFNVAEDELRIGWNAPKSINYNVGSTLLTLILETTNDFQAGDEFQLKIIDDSRNQLADSEYEPIENIVLSAPGVVFSPTGLNETKFDNGSMMEIYPNPFQETTFINYTIPEEGEVTIEVFNVRGVLLKTLINKVQEQGRYSVKYSSSKNEPGIYSVILRLKLTNKDILSVAKIINHSR